MATPKANIFWRDIPATSSVEDTGTLFVVTDLKGKKAVAYWMGNDAAEAQRTLKHRSKHLAIADFYRPAKEVEKMISAATNSKKRKR